MTIFSNTNRQKRKEGVARISCIFRISLPLRVFYKFHVDHLRLCLKIRGGGKKFPKVRWKIRCSDHMFQQRQSKAFAEKRHLICRRHFPWYFIRSAGANPKAKKVTMRVDERLGLKISIQQWQKIHNEKAKEGVGKTQPQTSLNTEVLTTGQSARSA